MSRLTIIRGLPGSGKSTLARELSKKTGAIVIEPDMFCIHNGVYHYTERDYQRARRYAAEFVRRTSHLGADIIYADVLPRYQDVNQVIGNITANGYDIEVYSIQTPKDVSISRNRHEVYYQDIAGMAEDWDAEYTRIANAAGTDTRHVKEYFRNWDDPIDS